MFFRWDKMLNFTVAAPTSSMKLDFNPIIVLVVTWVVLCVGCAPNEPATTWKPVTSLTSRQQLQKAHAMKAKESLSAALSLELKAAMADPAAAIHFCKAQAPIIASQIEKEQNLRIGRTSFQIRNLNNQPPQWAKGFVNARVNDAVTLQLADDGLGLLFPIRVKTVCLHCHGQQSEMDPSIFAAVLSDYPDDNATGFKVGDLRGYFWIEVPVMDR